MFRSAFRRVFKKHAGGVKSTGAIYSAAAVNFNQQQESSKMIFLFAGMTLASAGTLASCDGNKDKKWKVYSRKEVEAHNTSEKRVWVTYKNGVYDVTDFIVNHPGGQEKLMSVAGQDIASSWNIYQQHKTSELALDLLQEMKIGELAPKDIVVVSDAKNAKLFSNKPVYDCIVVGAGLSGLKCGHSLVNEYESIKRIFYFSMLKIMSVDV